MPTNPPRYNAQHVKGQVIKPMAKKVGPHRNEHRCHSVAYRRVQQVRHGVLRNRVALPGVSPSATGGNKRDGTGGAQGDTTTCGSRCTPGSAPASVVRCGTRSGIPCLTPGLPAVPVRSRVTSNPSSAAAGHSPRLTYLPPIHIPLTRAGVIGQPRACVVGGTSTNSWTVPRSAAWSKDSVVNQELSSNLFSGQQIHDGSKPSAWARGLTPARLTHIRPTLSSVGTEVARDAPRPPCPSKLNPCNAWGSAGGQELRQGRWASQPAVSASVKASRI